MESCPSFADLQLWLAEEFPVQKQEKIALHVSDCSSCQTALDGLTAFDLPNSIHENRSPQQKLLLFFQQQSQLLDSDTDAVTDAEATKGYEPPNDVPVSVELEKYKVLEELGRGGMGVVYKALEIALDRLVAVKMIVHGSSSTSEQRLRFQREAQAIAKLDHPNIVRIYEIGEHQGNPFISLELVAGGSLSQKLSKRPIPPMEAARLVEALAHGIEAAHQAGVIHRDLKPANVLLTETGVPKITDFGLAKQLDLEGDTSSGVIMGTPAYMAPEQVARKTAEVSPSVDIHALGAILFECLTGEPPFNAATQVDTILKVISQEVSFPARFRSSIPHELQIICLKCLEKTADRRYISAAALADDLGRYQNHQPISAKPASSFEKTWRWCKRNPMVAALLGVIFVVLLGGVSVSTFFYLNERELAQHSAQQAERLDVALSAARQSESDALNARDEARLTAAERTLTEALRLASEGYSDLARKAFTETLRTAPPGPRSMDLRRVTHVNIAAWRTQVPPLRYSHSVTGSDSGAQELFCFRAGDSGNFLTVHQRVLGKSPFVVRTWRFDTGQPIGKPFELEFHQFPVSIHPDGHMLAVRSYRRPETMRILTVPTGCEDKESVLHHLVHGEATRANLFIKFTQNPAVYAATKKPKSGFPFQFRDAGSGRKLAKEILLGAGDSFRITEGDDGRPVLVSLLAGDDYRQGSVEFSDLTTGKKLPRPTSFPTRLIAISGTEAERNLPMRRVADWRVRQWDTTAGLQIGRAWEPAGPSQFAVVSGDRAVFHGRDGLLRVFDTKARRLIGKSWFVPDLPEVGFARTLPSSIALSPDGNTLITLSEGGMIRAWDLSALPAFPEPPESVPFGVLNSAEISTGGRTVFTGPDQVVVVPGPTQKGAPICLTFDHLMGASLDPRGHRLAVGFNGSDKDAPRVRILDTKTGKTLEEFSLPKLIYSVRFGPSGRTLAVGCVGATFLSDTLRKTLRELPESSTAGSLAFTPDGKRLLVGYMAGWAGVGPGVRVWSVTTGRPLSDFIPIQTATRGPKLACFDRGKRFLLHVERERRPRVFQITDQVTAMEQANAPVGREIAAVTDGTLAAFVRRTGAVEIWDMVSPRVLLRTIHPKEPTQFLTFNPDGKLLAISAGSRAQLWDVRTGFRLGPPIEHLAPILALRFAEDGRTLFSASADGAVNAYQLPKVKIDPYKGTE